MRSSNSRSAGAVSVDLKADLKKLSEFGARRQFVFFADKVQVSAVQGLLESKDTHCPRVLQ